MRWLKKDRVVVEQPFIIRQVHERVFYMEFDENNQKLVKFCEWLGGNLVRDELKDGVKSKYVDDVRQIVDSEPDFHLEDAGWPMTPPGVRLVFRTEESAQRMIEQYRDSIFFQEADEKFMISDPDVILRPW